MASSDPRTSRAQDGTLELPDSRECPRVGPAGVGVSQVFRVRVAFRMVNHLVSARLKHSTTLFTSSAAPMTILSMPRLPLPSWMRSRRARVLPQTVFRVTLERHDNPYDILLAGHRAVQGIVVVDVSKSEAIRRWNNENPDSTLELGHVIVEVNGHTDPRDMLDQMSEAPQVSLLVNTMPNKDQWAIFRHCRKKHEREVRVESILEEVHCCGNEICAICHEDMGDGCTVAKLPCGHLFHKECVTKWLVGGKLRCPLCNSSVVLPSETTFQAEEIVRASA